MPEGIAFRDCKAVMIWDRGDEMIKLIATDVDGTLGEVSTPTIHEEYYAVVRRLLDKGIQIAIASGRQQPALAHLFAPMKDELIYIADNGAHVCLEGKDLYISKMTLETSRELVRDVRALGNDCECAYCVAGIAYFSPQDKNVYRVMKEKMNYDCRMVDSLEELQEPCIKMTVYHPTDAEGATAEWFAPKWKERLQVACSGFSYLDIMNEDTNKGESLKKVQEYYGITKEETMAFGDNFNDLEMFEQAYYSYAVGDARKEVIDSARFTAQPMKENGVLQELKKFLETLD